MHVELDIYALANSTSTIQSINIGRSTPPIHSLKLLRDYIGHTLHEHDKIKPGRLEHGCIFANSLSMLSSSLHPLQLLCAQLAHPAPSAVTDSATLGSSNVR